MALSLTDAISQLGHDSSPKRRSAAKALRRLGDATAGPALMAALEAEARDPRTWETQYQMVMALGECRYLPARPWLMTFGASLEGPLMLAVGVGDAVVRLGINREGADAGVAWALATGQSSILEGALRALAMTRRAPSEAVIERILDYLTPLGPQDGLRFWAAVAAVDWSHERARVALDGWASLPRKDVAEAATTSLSGKYRRYNPL